MKFLCGVIPRTELRLLFRVKIKQILLSQVIKNYFTKQLKYYKLSELHILL